MALPRENKEDRDDGAIVGRADIAEMRSRIAALTRPGQVLNQAGMVETTSAAQTKAMFFATKS